ncbi:hypothetical protein FRC04_011567 [Tulasnella sp. 424]|nr:hypothetical protein FRC04_011567 [Tulasnella sp. 424]KAG8971567.1 hypothetical protein FRC05_010977 [Tulasnella sp. 425]
MPTAAAAARTPRQFAPYHQSSSPESDAAGEPSRSAPPVGQDARDAPQTQGTPAKEKPRAYIACQTCRSRKVRCDGRKPVCTNCEKRNASCIYDVVPRRRGPDKVPGTRQRGTKGASAAKKRKRTDEEDVHPVPADTLLGASSASSSSSQTQHVQPEARDLHPSNLPSIHHQQPSVSSQPELAQPPNKRQVTARNATTPPQPSVAINTQPVGIPVDSTATSSRVTSCDVAPRKNLNSTRSRIALSDLLSPMPEHRPGSYPSSASATVPSSSSSALTTANNLDAFPSAGGGSGGTFPLDGRPLSPSSSSHSNEVIVQHFFDDRSNYWHPVTDPTQAANFTAYQRPFAYRAAPYASAHIVSVEEEDDHDDEVVVFGTYIEKPHTSSIAREPSLRFSQATWWDAVLSLYGHPSRKNAAQAVQTDLQNLFKMSSSWFSFFNVPLFFSLFCHPEHRALMQPSLVLSCLAYSSFMLGSEAEGGVLQRRKSTQLRELAQAAFEASYNAGWIDVPLAQAAWVMSLYEMSAHPDTSGPRMTASLVLLDNVIKVLGLTCIDAENPRSPIFVEYAVPALGRCAPEAGTSEPSHHPLRLTHLQHTQNFPQVVYHTTTQPTPFDSYRDVAHYPPVSASAGCPCQALSLGSAVTPAIRSSTPLWLLSPKWDAYDVNRDYAEIRREESRRLVWSTLTIVGGDRSARLALEQPQLDLHLAKPENYALLYPGETLYASRPEIDSAFSAKESTWALYARTMLLWIACTRVWGSTHPGWDKSDFAMRTWMETTAIEDALNQHSCDGEKATMYQAREYLNIIRIFISSGFRQFIPVPQSGTDFSRVDRGKAMQWLAHQNDVANQLQAVLASDPYGMPARLLLRRPYLIWWQMNQIHRAMILWTLDHSLTFAVDVALNMLPIARFLSAMWPCPEQRRRMKRLMGRLERICMFTSQTIPAPPSFEAFMKKPIA